LSRRQREWPPALQPAVDFVRERWSEEQQTVGGLIGVNALVHLLWWIPGLQVGTIQSTAYTPFVVFSASGAYPPHAEPRSWCDDVVSNSFGAQGDNDCPVAVH